MPNLKTARIRGRHLQRIRAEHFRLHPLCVLCQSKVPPRVTVAVELDHIVSLDHGGTNDPANYQGLCTDCHSDKSIKERGYKCKRKVTIGADGWPVAR
ncbi:MAG: HNH endonuclease [Candidatus Nitrotoga sp. SPKER]|nr:MAG: HNH endonuclease [Candidatus Nitrotoga sp. SPKER]